MNKYETREQWLESATTLLRPTIEEHGNLPDKLHIITSWPYGNKKAIGQCFSSSWTKEGANYICISPKLGEDLPELLGVLAHELIHAMIGVDKNHGKAFKRVATAIGLVGQMRATEVGPELRKKLEGMLMQLGSYPHAQMMPPVKEKKEAKRKQILKFMSPVEPTYTCWLTPAQAANVGPPICPISKELMLLAGGDV